MAEAGLGAYDLTQVMTMGQVVPCPSREHMHDSVEVRYILSAKAPIPFRRPLSACLTTDSTDPRWHVIMLYFI